VVVAILFLVGGLFLERLEARAAVELPGEALSQVSLQATGAPAGPTGPTTPGTAAELPRAAIAPTGPYAPPSRVRDTDPGPISSGLAVVIDGDSGLVLWGRDEHGSVPPASLTKIVTALVVLERAKPTDLVRVQVDSRRMTDSTVMGIWPGEELTVGDLLYGMMLPSGNDAALALAIHLAGSKEAFGELMTAKAHALGLTESRFANPHGLDEAEHYSSAYDMAMLARHAMQYPLFRDLAAARFYETERGKGYELGNLNRFLWRYVGADGVKIGYTPDAGRTIVASAVKDGHRLIAAVMRGGDIYGDAELLLDWGFATFQWQPAS
jgi:D-alanyl-D-alanine carboxypeptidase (penicillin-binding protein 5/6)